jgi:hypothetical protein
MFINDNDLFVPVLIPKATTPQVSGLNSSWVTALGLLAGAALFGPSMRNIFKGNKVKKVKRVKKK